MIQNHVALLYFGIVHLVITTALICSIILFIKRREGDRSRMILACVWFVTFIIGSLRISYYYIGVDPGNMGLFPANTLIAGLFAVTLFLLYPIEVIRPGLINFKSLLLIFSAQIGLLVLSKKMDFERIEHIGELFTLVNHRDMLFRIFIIMLVVLGMFLLLAIPRKSLNHDIGRGWIRLYAYTSAGIGVLWLLHISLGIYPYGIVHMLYMGGFIAWATYYELYNRLYVVDKYSPNSTINHSDLSNQPIETVFTKTEDSLWEKFENYMRIEKPWLSPDITVGEVAKAIMVGRTKLSTEISAKGNDSFHTLVARYRIAEFCEMAQRGEVENVNEALFAVGFRSRSTAYDRFKEQMGKTPAEYIKTLKADNS